VTTQPGAVPLRPLAMGEILDGAMSLLHRFPAATLGLGAAVMTVQLALTVPVQFLTQGFTFSLISRDTTGGAGLDPVLALLGVALSTTLLAVIASACTGVVSGLTAAVVGDAALGHPVAPRSVWTQVRTRMWPLIGLALLVAVAGGIGQLLLLAGWVFLTGVLAVAIPAVVLERAGVIRAIRRSWDLTIGDFFRVLGIRLLALFVGWVLQTLVGLPFLLASLVVTFDGSGGQVPGDGQLLAGVVLAGLGTFAGSVVSAPFLGCVDALLYTDRRMRAEGLDIEIGQRVRRAAAERGAA
jgi:hypothetical protein